jgi:hypothetical protein
MLRQRNVTNCIMGQRLSRTSPGLKSGATEETVARHNETSPEVDIGGARKGPRSAPRVSVASCENLRRHDSDIE